MRVLIVDWLGRAGIAQCSEAWAMCYTDASIDVAVVTRPDRELGQGVVTAQTATPRRFRVTAHLAVVAKAVEVIERERPGLVVVQNYVLPFLETPVYDAARRIGARVVMVVHDHRLHSRTAGTTWGLRHLARQADTVVAHSHFVGDTVARETGRPVRIVPHPLQTGMLAAPAGAVPFTRRADTLVAGHFGVLRRTYKGVSVVAGLAQSPPLGWEFVLMGVGAPAVPGVVTVNRFLDPGELVSSVHATDATVLPYLWATQSGAVVLAQALGSVVVTSAVGGVVEQVEHERTGLLLEPAAPEVEWRAALARLNDDTFRHELASAARDKVADDHATFCRAALELVDVDPDERP